MYVAEMGNFMINQIERNKLAVKNNIVVADFL
jgi:hypothetical protein